VTIAWKTKTKVTREKYAGGLIYIVD